jgi:alpha-tubulin suppressor-like RCC1 family protein
VAGLENVAALGLGVRHSCAVLGIGSVWCWGGNDGGQAGGETARAVYQPRKVTVVRDAVGLAAGVTTTCAWTAGGEVVCWGQDVTEGGEH